MRPALCQWRRCEAATTMRRGGVTRWLRSTATGASGTTTVRGAGVMCFVVEDLRPPGTVVAVCLAGGDDLLVGFERRESVEEKRAELTPAFSTVNDRRRRSAVDASRLQTAIQLQSPATTIRCRFQSPDSVTAVRHQVRGFKPTAAPSSLRRQPLQANLLRLFRRHPRPRHFSN
ncbi:FAD synthase [Striga asiatica]|uniref:FAD synthase n=1 Tax=Striga asiatica TaxID=4170 RepID=A0A5A7PU89_STRAF|nr:FAD synthase [Striga asiatica]